MSKLKNVPEIHLLAGGFLLNGVWEFLQSPLYADHDRGVIYVVWTRLHCTIGDLMILVLSFWGASLLFGTRFWCFRESNRPLLVFLGLGFAYTIWSEWFNTRVALSWEYSNLMPQVFGIGLTPLLQWLILPLVLIVWMRRRLRMLGHP